MGIGSAYQYFPNKASILFRLQSEEWQQTSQLMVAILQVRDPPPLQRLRELVHAFLHSECKEAALRMALHDTAPLYRDAPEAAAVGASGGKTPPAFVAEVLPDLEAAQRMVVTDLLQSTLGSGRQTVFRAAAQSAGDRGAGRCDGRYVLRLSTAAGGRGICRR